MKVITAVLTLFIYSVTFSQSIQPVKLVSIISNIPTLPVSPDDAYAKSNLLDPHAGFSPSIAFENYYKSFKTDLNDNIDKLTSYSKQLQSNILSTGKQQMIEQGFDASKIDKYKLNGMSDQEAAEMVMRSNKNVDPKMREGAIEFQKELAGNKKMAKEFNSMNDKQQQEYIKQWMTSKGYMPSNNASLSNVKKSEFVKDVPPQLQMNYILDNYLHPLDQLKIQYYDQILRGKVRTKYEEQLKQLDLKENEDLEKVPMIEAGEAGHVPDPAKEQEVKDHYKQQRKIILENRLNDMSVIFQTYKAKIYQLANSFDQIVAKYYNQNFDDFGKNTIIQTQLSFLRNFQHEEEVAEIISFDALIEPKYPEVTSGKNSKTPPSKPNSNLKNLKKAGKMLKSLF